MAKKDRKPKTAFQKLNYQQQNFVLAYTGVNLYDGKEACRTAQYASKSDKSLYVQAFRLLKNVKIKDAIAEVVQQAIIATDITPEKVLFDLDKIKQVAMAKGNPSAALRAVELIGKYQKMFIDRVEHVRSIDDVTDDELYETMGYIASKLGDANITAILAGQSGRLTSGSEESAGSDIEDNPTTH